MPFFLWNVKINLIDFETLDNDIIDFTESNPFGTVGSTTDTTI